MEYIEGAPLKGPLPVQEALRLAVQVAEGLDAAHRRGRASFGFAISIRRLCARYLARRASWGPSSRPMAVRWRSRSVAVSGASISPAQRCRPFANCMVETSGPMHGAARGSFLVTEAGVIQRVSASGGAPKQVTTLDALAFEEAHLFAHFLPDERRFLYYAYHGTAQLGAVFVGSVDDPKLRQRLLGGTGPAAYAPPGWLLFARDDVLLPQPFDASKLELSGEAT
jgi:hypothetical protein